MVEVPIFYSIRKTNNLPELAFFADEFCARLDQEYFKFWEKPCWGRFLIEVRGFAYLDQVKTVEEYLTELENKDPKPTDLIQQLLR